MNLRQISGPVTGDQTTTGTQTPIQGILTRAAYGIGPIFFNAHLVANNQGATQANLLFLIRRNGTVNVRGYFASCFITTQQTFTFCGLLPPFPGFNLYTLEVQQNAGGVVTLPQFQCILSVIELPDWDQLPLGLSG